MTESETERKPPRIELRRLSKSFPSGGRTLTVLREVDLALEAGESLAILGPSGSGKSTLLALIAGLDRPSAGQVLIDGRPIQNLSEDQLALFRRHSLGFVFQSFQLLPHLTARENVLLPLELSGRRGARARADELLESVGLSDRSHHYPGQLSGGEQQRVALARAFSIRPAILLADEPTGNLDRNTGELVLTILADLVEGSGTTLVLVTHDPDAAALAERHLMLVDGELVGGEPGA